MKLKEIKIDRDWNGNPRIEATIYRKDEKELEKLMDIDPNDYEIKIEKIRKKRSLDANAYFWLLVGKISAKIKRKNKLEIYREYIKETSAFEILPIREDVIERFENEIWGNKGDGWVCEDLGECRNAKGYHNIKAYYGTSVYDSKEMSHLIDMVVQDCQALEIETLPPEEIKRLKEMWK